MIKSGRVRKKEEQQEGGKQEGNKVDNEGGRGGREELKGRKKE